MFQVSIRYQLYIGQMSVVRVEFIVFGVRAMDQMFVYRVIFFQDSQVDLDGQFVLSECVIGVVLFRVVDNFRGFIIWFGDQEVIWVGLFYWSSYFCFIYFIGYDVGEGYRFWVLIIWDFKVKSGMMKYEFFYLFFIRGIEKSYVE